MAAFAPLNQIVWRDYTSITGGLERNAPENKLVESKNGPSGNRGGGEQQHALTAAAAMENTLNAKEDSKGASQILMPSREMQGNKNKMSIPSACPILNTYTSQQRFLV